MNNESDVTFQSLDRFFQSAIDELKTPGLVAMATTGDEVIYQGSFGDRVFGSHQSMSIDTVARIASMSKPLTSVAALQLMEQGKLELNSPARSWVPEIANCQVLEGWTTDGKPRLRSPKEEITLKHLLTHTAGFGYEFLSNDERRYREFVGLPERTSGKKRSIQSVLLFDPGERWEYSLATDWIGLMIESATGQSLGSVMKANLFDPLEMHSTSFKISSEMRSRLAKVHQRNNQGDWVDIDFEVNQSPEFESGGSGIYSTAEDYLHLIQMILNDGQWKGQQLLQPESIAIMSANAIGMLTVSSLESVIPQLSNSVDFLPGILKGWGLGFMTNESPASSGRCPGSLFWAGLANTYFWIDPTAKLGGVFISQVLPFADSECLTLFNQFEKEVYAKISFTTSP